MKLELNKEETSTYLERMRKCKSQATDFGHVNADDILCELVEKYVPNGIEIVKEFHSFEKWYS